MRSERPTVTNILGQEIHAVQYEDVLRHVDQVIAAGRSSYCVTANIDHLMKLRRDAEFRVVYSGADLVVADGVPLLWAARFLGSPLPARVNGTALFEHIAAHAARAGYALFFLGGAGDSARRAANVLTVRYPGLQVVGVSAPPQGFDLDERQNSTLESQIAASGAQILIVGLGAPKQEKWIAKHARAAGVNFAVGVGVSFSLVAGTIARAPAWMQRNGLEWLWRLSQEPGRLWRRYLIEDMPFFWLVARQWWTGPPAIASTPEESPQ